jgi:hypothetical protein
VSRRPAMPRDRFAAPWIGGHILRPTRQLSQRVPRDQDCVSLTCSCPPGPRLPAGVVVPVGARTLGARESLPCNRVFTAAPVVSRLADCPGRTHVSTSRGVFQLRWFSLPIRSETNWGSNTARRLVWHKRRRTNLGGLASRSDQRLQRRREVTPNAAAAVVARECRKGPWTAGPQTRK